MPGGNRGLVAALKQVFDVRADRERDLRPARVMGRATDGRTLLQDLAGECILAEGSGGHLGQIVTQLPALANRTGTTGVPVIGARDVARLLSVTSVEPASFPRGATAFEVIVTGYGFTATTAFDFLLPASEELHPDVTIAYQNLIDAEHIQLGLNIAADADLVVEAPIAFDEFRRVA